jgi:hypothetical protein
MFEDIKNTLNLKLWKATTWISGIVALWHRLGQMTNRKGPRLDGMKIAPHC